MAYILCLYKNFELNSNRMYYIICLLKLGIVLVMTWKSCFDILTNICLSDLVSSKITTNIMTMMEILKVNIVKIFNT